MLQDQSKTKTPAIAAEGTNPPMDKRTKLCHYKNQIYINNIK